MTSHYEMTWPMSTSTPIASNDTPLTIYGLPVVEHAEVWTPEVTQRVATVVILMVITFVGNVTVVARLTSCRHRNRKSAAATNTSPVTQPPSRVNIFIVNLAVGDLTVCCFTMTTEVLFVVFEKAWVLGAVACRVLLYIQVITLASTTFLLTAMSFDRYLAICKPLTSLPAASQTRRRRMIALAWLMAFIFASPQLLIFKQVPAGVYPEGVIKYKCASRGYTAWWQRKLYFTFMASYILVVPAILMTFCYVNVALVVWKRSRELSNAKMIIPNYSSDASDQKNESTELCNGDQTINNSSPVEPASVAKNRLFHVGRFSRENPADGSSSKHATSAQCTSRTAGRGMTMNAAARTGTGNGIIRLRRSVYNHRAMSRARVRTVQMTLCIVCLFIACWMPYFVVHLIHIWTEYRHQIPETVYVFAETLALVNSAVNPLLYGCFNAACCNLCCCTRRKQPLVSPSTLTDSHSVVSTVSTAPRTRLDHTCSGGLDRSGRSAHSPQGTWPLAVTWSSDVIGRRGRTQSEWTASCTLSNGRQECLLPQNIGRTSPATAAGVSDSNCLE